MSDVYTLLSVSTDGDIQLDGTFDSLPKSMDELLVIASVAIRPVKGREGKVWEAVPNFHRVEIHKNYHIAEPS